MITVLVGAKAANAQTPLLKELAKEDQAVRCSDPCPESAKKITRTDDERRKIVLEMIGKGELKGPEDKFNAALILQHTGMTFCEGRLVSYSAENYLLAHFLFQSAYDAGYKDALYLIAASMDRYLSMTEGTQKYGTNREFNQKTEKEEWVPIDRKTTDAERAKYGIPPLAELLKQYPEQATPKKKWQ
jgi:hypothetical protein|nr:hypothetical protein [Candidatus Acidoferrales bacterium]